MLQWTTTSQATLHGVKALVYGRSGAGKTTLCATLPQPVIISCEAGLLSIRHTEIPVMVVSTFAELTEAYNWLVQDGGRTFRSVALDSISEIAERCLEEQKRFNKDGRKAYGEMNDLMLGWIRAFRDLAGMHVLFTAKKERIDTGNSIKEGASMPGRTLTQQLPYFFDEVFNLAVGEHEGKTFRYLQTQPDAVADAKDRSGSLALHETPDMNNIINKICHNQ